MEQKQFNPALQTRRVALSWDKENKPRVDDLRAALSEGLDQPLGNKELFFVCLAYGWKAQVKSPSVPSRASDSARMETLNNGDWALFNSIAMNHAQSFDILGSKDGVLDVVESFAAGGLALLIKQLDATMDLFSYVSKDLWPIVLEWKESKD